MITVKLETAGMNEMVEELERIEGQTRSEKIIGDALKKGAEPIRQQILENIESGRHIRSRRLYNSIAIGNMSKGRGKGYQIKIGSIGDSAPHARLVEYGHGGPKPAPEHPYMEPAYEAKKGEAIEIVASALREALGL